VSRAGGGRARGGGGAISPLTGKRRISLPVAGRDKIGSARGIRPWASVALARAGRGAAQREGGGGGGGESACGGRERENLFDEK